MKQSLSSWRIAVAASVLTLAAGPAAFHANADEWNKKTVLTVNQPIQIRETVLQPGQYVLQLLSSNSDRHIVEIFNGDQSHLINTVLAFPKQRTKLTGDTQFTFWETPPGTAKALRAWFYPGDTVGQEFPYPRHTEMLAMLEKPAPVTEPAPVTQPAPAPVPATQPAVTEPTPESSAAEMTPATPPTPTPVETEPAVPADQTPAAAPPPPPDQPTPPPAELPKTGSHYPLLGIGGMIFLGLAGLLRLKRPGLG